jgi:hypothetical protein
MGSLGASHFMLYETVPHSPPRGVTLFNLGEPRRQMRDWFAQDAVWRVSFRWRPIVLRGHCADI